jgi:hypothetical protein
MQLIETVGAGCSLHSREREVFLDNLLVRIRFIIEMIWWTGLTPWEFEENIQRKIFIATNTAAK